MDEIQLVTLAHAHAGAAGVLIAQAFRDEAIMCTVIDRGNPKPYHL